MVKGVSNMNSQQRRAAARRHPYRVVITNEGWRRLGAPYTQWLKKNATGSYVLRETWSGFTCVFASKADAVWFALTHQLNCEENHA
jgi:hypothetical protein